MFSTTPMAERIAKLSKRPESKILTTTDAQRQAMWFTIPMFEVPRNLDDKPDFIGCGCLVKLGEKHFVLTAGHVIKDLFGQQEDDPFPQFLPVFGKHIQMTSCFSVSHSYRYDRSQSIDFGFIEVPELDANRWKTNSKLALSADKIRVERIPAFQDDDYYVFTGTPHAKTKERDDHQLLLELTHWTTSVAGRRSVPRATAGAAMGVEYLDLAFDPSNLTTCVVDGELRPAELFTEIGGVSGGPCWKANIVDDPHSWQPNNLTLVATHVGRHSRDAPPNAGYMFAREVLIGHHLRLIATEYAGRDTERFLLDTWPQLAEWPQL